MFSKKLKKKMKKSLAIVAGGIATLTAAVVLVNNSETMIKVLNSNQKEEIQRASISVNNATNETLKNQINSSSKIVAGGNHFVALTADGKVYGWGYNNYGQLGTADNASKLEPVQALAVVLDEEGNVKKDENQKNITEKITDAIDIASGYNFTLVLRKDGSVWAAGYNVYGQLGNNSTTNSNVFVKVKNENGTAYLENIKAVYAGDQTSYAVSNEGDLYAWGRNNVGQCGLGTTSSIQYLPYKSLGNVEKVASGTESTIVLTKDKKVYGVGLNTSGQLGVGSIANQTTWVEMKDSDNVAVLQNVKDISAGTWHKVILKEDGTVWSVGFNMYGQLGDGTSGTDARKSNLVQALDSEGNPLTNIEEIYASGNSTFAKDKNGQLYAVGQNTYGGLITRNATNQTNFVKVDTKGKAEKIAATEYVGSGNTIYGTTAWIDDIGRIYTVGYNGYGQLGNETTENSVNYEPYSITNIRIAPNESIVNLAKGEAKNITTSLLTENLLVDKAFNVNYNLKSLDTNIITTNGNTITAVGVGTTYIRIEDNTNKIYGSIKVNVNETKTIARKQSSWRIFTFCSIKIKWRSMELGL